MSDDRWDGEHGHLYDGTAKCSRCRFYAKDPAIIAKHELGCTGHPKAIYNDPRKQFFCRFCRFDGETVQDVIDHHQRGDCVNELSAIFYPLYALNYDVTPRGPPGPRDEGPGHSP